MKSKIETKKFERTFVFEDFTVIWKYDTSRSVLHPIEVEIKYPKKTQEITKKTPKKRN
jgi:hypothetical protein